MASENTQKKIKSKAIFLFNEFGTSNVSIGKIAGETGISRGNFQYHYKTKQELIRAIYKDISKEVLDNWASDDKRPTIDHMAEMFARQLDYVWKYRFIYREMVPLIRADPDLALMVRTIRAQRIEVVIKFFKLLVKNKVIKRPRSNESLRYLVMMTWIFCDNYLNFIEIQGVDINSETIQEGYDHIIEILDPYLTEQARKNIYMSYALIKFHSDK